MMRLLHSSKAKSLFFLTQRLLTYHNNRKCQHSGIFQGRGHHFCWTMGGTKNSNDLREAFFLFCDAYEDEDFPEWTIKILLHFYAPVSPTKDDFILSIIWKKATISRIQKCSECVSKNVSAILIQPSDIFYVSGGPQLWHLSLFCLQIFASFFDSIIWELSSHFTKKHTRSICYFSFHFSRCFFRHRKFLLQLWISLLFGIECIFDFPGFPRID